MAQTNSLPWHRLSVHEVFACLQAGPEGLSDEEAERRLALHGPNALSVEAPPSPWSILAAQGKSLIVLLLLVAAAGALVVGDLLEAAAISAVVIVNVGIGFWVEWRARQEMRALRALQLQEAVVLRNGEERRVDARDVVPGDVISLEAGSAVPVDARMISAHELRVVEAPLTGESVPVDKSPDPVGPEREGEEVPLAERASMVYKGTMSVAGTGQAVVVATGSATEIGRIAALVQDTPSEDTPLERKLAVLGRRLVWITLGVAALVVAMGVVRGGDLWLMFETGVALAVAAVPEGLPLVATITLALGMRRMARRRALVRRLPAVETLGSVTVICADKTGTLTAAEMTANSVEVAGRFVEVTGRGYELAGEIIRGGERVDVRDVPGLDLAVRIGVLTNRARLRESAAGLAVDGDPTEGALLVLGKKAGVTRERLLSDYPKVAEVPFSSERMWMATFHRTPAGRTVAYVKGSPRMVLEVSAKRLVSAGPRHDSPDAPFEPAEGPSVPLDDGGREALLVRNRELGGRGLRLLSLAYRELDPGEEPNAEAIHDLTFVGYVGMSDPPAAGVRETIQLLREAGVRTVMITGDQEVTAKAIGRDLGVLGEGDETLDGREIMRLGDAELAKSIGRVAAFSRVSPEDKLRIVRAYQERGEIVGMLGDGVNDAPALKRADIGVAMGGRGTDVAKETAAVVLQDDRFETVAAAVQEGRVIFDNIRKFIFYLFSCNLSEVLVLFVSGVAGLPLPLLPLQLLWLNFVTDVFPALALAVEPAEPDVMRRAPRDPGAAILSRDFMVMVGAYGVLITVATLAVFIWGLSVPGVDTEHAVTLAFMTLALAQLLHVVNARGTGPLLWSRRLFTNAWVWAAIVLGLGLQLSAVYVPWLARVLGTRPLSLQDWGIVLVASLMPLVVGQLWKGVASSSAH